VSVGETALSKYVSSAGSRTEHATASTVRETIAHGIPVRQCIDTSLP
jgi:hypothetical protein